MHEYGIISILLTCNMKNTTQIKRKRCRNGTRRHKKSHRCRKVLKKIIKN